jgi:hypothetical protein
MNYKFGKKLNSLSAPAFIRSSTDYLKYVGFTHLTG